MVKVLKFRISIVGLGSVWREFCVSDEISFYDLHLIIQDVMGWYNCHLHEFDIDGVKIGRVDDEVGYDLLEERKVLLRDYISEERQSFEYLYDFGDGWSHKVTVKEIMDGDFDNPVCLKGKGCCPPEDSGGVYGYKNILEILKDKDNPEYCEMREWMDEDFDADKFEVPEL